MDLRHGPSCYPIQFYINNKTCFFGAYWSANNENDLASYKVYGGTSLNPTTVLSTISAGTQTYMHSSLANGTYYYYRISAVDGLGNESTVSSNISGKAGLAGYWPLDGNGNNSNGTMPDAASVNTVTYSNSA